MKSTVYDQNSDVQR